MIEPLRNTESVGTRFSKYQDDPPHEMPTEQPYIV